MRVLTRPEFLVQLGLSGLVIVPPGPASVFSASPADAAATSAVALTRTLNDGYKVPALGYGTYRANGKELKTGLLKAIEEGYRHIDTAAYYRSTTRKRLWCAPSYLTRPRTRAFGTA